MNLKSFYQNRIYTSENAKQGARELIYKMKNNILELEVLPNSFDDYTGELETENYLSFCQFVDSRKGKLVLSKLNDGGDCIG